ncbi:SRPBCC domain-containing protein [Intrasporangium flavum]|uniref:SRPBCC domain-containing protein n=1 Tax=Intrasporangium flavum TaxID=1428657 RepID=UPI00096EE7AB|nr:SRPBCC domain-containing protein [Intrasporangium flavum]
MRLRHDQELDAPADLVWEHFMDLRRIGRSFPGAEVTEVDGDAFVGQIRARLGPLSVWFDGTGSMIERDASARRARLEATGQERHGLGKATIGVTLTLHPLTAERTRARLDTSLDFYGMPLEVGRGLVQRASDPLIERFLTNMARAGDAAGDAPGATDDDSGPLDLVRTAGDLLGSFRRDGGRRRR